MIAGGPVSDLAGMLAELAPVLDARRWAFVVVEEAPLDEAFAIIREDEGTTAIVSAADGDFARITLMVHSALEGVGLTAAVAGVLAERGIACNVVAGFRHDHLFVPWARAEEAMEALTALRAFFNQVESPDDSENAVNQKHRAVDPMQSDLKPL